LGVLGIFEAIQGRISGVFDVLQPAVTRQSLKRFCAAFTCLWVFFLVWLTAASLLTKSVTFLDALTLQSFPDFVRFWAVYDTSIVWNASSQLVERIALGSVDWAVEFLAVAPLALNNYAVGIDFQSTPWFPIVGICYCAPFEPLAFVCEGENAFSLGTLEFCSAVAFDQALKVPATSTIDVPGAPARVILGLGAHLAATATIRYQYSTVTTRRSLTWAASAKAAQALSKSEKG